ncbi:MAG: glycosyltransferase family 4 protein [Acidimicrobiia bacterium]
MLKRVLLVSPYALTTPGGVQAQVLGLAHILRDRGIDARVIGPCDGPPPEPGIYSIGPSMSVDGNGSMAPISFGTEVSRRTLQLARDLDPDVIHLHEPFVPGPNNALLFGSTVPTVGTFHAAGDIPWYRRARRIATASANQLDVVTVVSPAAAALISGFWDGPVVMIPNGIAIEPFRTAPAQKTRVPVIAFVGRHEERKGLGVLIEAFSKVQAPCELWVVGSGPETEALKRRNVPNVRWLGVVDDATRNGVLSTAEIFAAPSLGGESFGIVLVEAMAGGAAVVASDIPGYREVVESGVSGLLAAPGEVPAWTSAIERVLADPALRASLISAGKERAESFALDRVTDRYIACYEEALRSRSARAKDSGRSSP